MVLNNTVIAAINFVAILLSIPIIAAGIWLSSQADSSCLNLLQWPIIILGVLVLAVALAGFIGAFWRLPMILLFYLVAMFLLILALAGLVVFIFVVTNSVGPGHLAPSRLFLEYELDDDSGWLKHRVEGSYQWNRIKECLSSTSVCTDLNQTYSSAQSFFNSMLTPLQVLFLFFCFFCYYLLIFIVNIYYPSFTNLSSYHTPTRWKRIEIKKNYSKFFFFWRNNLFK